MKTTKKLISLLLTLVLALSVSTMTAFASFTPEWVDDVTAKVDAVALELETTDGFQFSMFLFTLGGSFTAGCDALDTPVYAQNGSVYTISGNEGSHTNTYEVTLDEDGEVASVKTTADDNGGNVVEMIFGRVHHPSYVPMLAPTMTEDGYMGYYECACGKFFKDSDATNEIEDIDAWKTTPGMGLIYKLGMEEPTTEEEETAPAKTTTKAPAKTTAKADDTKKSPQTGATAMGLGVAGLGVALLAVAKKKD